ncbi:MAG: BON domain-containing protein [Steroidobacteraceae bacterium]
MKIKTVVACTIVPVLALAAEMSVAQTSAGSQPPSSAARAPDNTKNNKLESNRSQTADDQKDNESDREITQRIRQSVMAEKNLSSYAHNAKIVAVNGTVTLNGVVQSEAEKNTLAQKAEQVVGSGHVVNKLKVAEAK